jgi:hypothetical protein
VALSEALAMGGQVVWSEFLKISGARMYMGV